MLNTQIVGRGVDTLVLNVSYADTSFKPIKQELASDLQAVLSRLQDEARNQEVAILTPWAFKGYVFYMQPKWSHGQWR